MNWLSTIVACIGMAVVTSGCATCLRHEQKPPCVSQCGMLLEDPGNGSMSCDQLQDAEDHMLGELDKEYCDKDARFCRENACHSLFGYQLHTTEDVIMIIPVQFPTEEGMMEVEVPVVGATSCRTREMHLAANQDWRHGSYPHELVHAIQKCDTGWEGNAEEAEHGPGHEGWISHGVYRLVDEIRTGDR